MHVAHCGRFHDHPDCVPRFPQVSEVLVSLIPGISTRATRKSKGGKLPELSSHDLWNTMGSGKKGKGTGKKSGKSDSVKQKPQRLPQGQSKLSEGILRAWLARNAHLGTEEELMCEWKALGFKYGQPPHSHGPRWEKLFGRLTSLEWRARLWGWFCEEVQEKRIEEAAETNRLKKLIEEEAENRLKKLIAEEADEEASSKMQEALKAHRATEQLQRTLDSLQVTFGSLWADMLVGAPSHREDHYVDGESSCSL